MCRNSVEVNIFIKIWSCMFFPALQESDGFINFFTRFIAKITGWTILVWLVFVMLACSSALIFAVCIFLLGL
jgi:hypothetical protein